jgi:hypothetical protein
VRRGTISTELPHTPQSTRTTRRRKKREAALHAEWTLLVLLLLLVVVIFSSCTHASAPIVPRNLGRSHH